MNTDKQVSPTAATPEAARPAYRKLSFRKNFSWVLAATLVNNLVTWSLLVILAKLSDPATVGLYSIGSAVVAPIFSFANLQLVTVLMTDTSQHCPYGRYVALRSLTTLAALAATGATVLVSGYDGQTAVVVMLLGVLIGVWACRDILLGIMRRNECMNLSARSQIAVAGASLVVFVSVFWATRLLVVAIVALIMARATVALVHDMPVARRVAGVFDSTSIRPIWSLRPLLHLATTALPLALSGALLALLLNMPKYFLKKHYGDEGVGYFSALVSVVAAASMLMNTLGVAAMPVLAKYYREHRRAFLRLTLKLVLIGATGGVGAIGVSVLFGRQMLTILFTADYAQYTHEFTIVIAGLALFFVLSFIANSIKAARGFFDLAVVCGLITVASYVSCLLLVKPYGIRGACWAQVITFGLWLLVLCIALTYRLYRSPPGAPWTASEDGQSEVQQ